MKATPVNQGADWTPRISQAQLQQINQIMDMLETVASHAAARPNRRQSERYPVRFPILCRVLDHHAEAIQFTGVCRNISKGGLGIVARRYVARGTPLTVFLPRPSGEAPREIEAQVVRCDYLSDMCYEIGLGFVELTQPG